MSANGRNLIISDLNEEFAGIVGTGLVTVDAAYGQIVDKVPYNCGVLRLKRVSSHTSVYPLLQKNNDWIIVIRNAL